MSQTNDNFDNLWASLKDSIREQRGERKGIKTFGETGINTVYGGHLQVGKIGKMSDKSHGYLHFGQAQINGIMCLHREDLMQLAAQCLGAVADMDEQP
jgi:hypothetical protein